VFEDTTPPDGGRRPGAGRGAPRLGALFAGTPGAVFDLEEKLSYVTG
jgi:hypothetical protein